MQDVNVEHIIPKIVIALEVIQETISISLKLY